MDALRQALVATQEIDPAPGGELIQRAKMEIWDTAVRHLKDTVGLEPLLVIYTSVTSEPAPNTQYDLDAAALLDEEERNAAAEIHRLSRLAPLEYERQRQHAAEKLAVRMSALDSAVKAARTVAGGDANGRGRPLNLTQIVPWDDAVDGVELLDAIAAAITRYVTLAKTTADAVVLWSVATHIFQAFEIFPRLAVRSATPRCGKTTLRNVVGCLVAKPLLADNIMAAALFRTIELERPTLLLDEADTYLSNNDDLRCIINSGHRRDGQVIRCVGDDHEPRQFSTWAPVLLAQIGNPPATVHDRSIAISLTRKKPSEQVQRFRGEERNRLHVLARMAARWASDNSDSIARKTPSALDYLNDRANDNWQPLLAIADTAGGAWPQRARDAARVLVESAGHDASSVGEMLLSDIQWIFDTQLHQGDDQPGMDRPDRIPSAELVEQLAKIDGRPWAEWRAGMPITQNALARLLKTFKITPSTIRLASGQTLKGYMRSEFDEVFECYGVSATVTPSQTNSDGQFRDFESVTRSADVTVEKTQKANGDGLCDGVTIEGGGNGDAA